MHSPKETSLALASWNSGWWFFAGTAAVGRFAFHKSVAAAGPGDPHFELLEFFLDAVAGRSGRNSRTWLDLPPFAVFAQAPPLLGMILLQSIVPILVVTVMIAVSVVIICVSHKVFSYEKSTLRYVSTG
jgi:hypothetical protein